MRHPDARARLSWRDATCRTGSRHSCGQGQRRRKQAVEQLKDRFGAIFQRRHDCIHNCDRPRISPQPFGNGVTVLRAIQDVEFLRVLPLRRSAFDAEFRQFLIGMRSAPRRPSAAALIGTTGARPWISFKSRPSIAETLEARPHRAAAPVWRGGAARVDSRRGSG